MRTVWLCIVFICDFWNCFKQRSICRWPKIQAQWSLFLQDFEVSSHVFSLQHLKVVDVKDPSLPTSVFVWLKTLLFFCFGDGWFNYTRCLKVILRWFSQWDVVISNASFLSFVAKSTPTKFWKSGNPPKVNLLHIAGLVCFHKSSKLFWVDSFSHSVWVFGIILVIPWGNNSVRDDCKRSRKHYGVLLQLVGVRLFLGPVLSLWPISWKKLTCHRSGCFFFFRNLLHVFHMFYNIKQTTPKHHLTFYSIGCDSKRCWQHVFIFYPTTIDASKVGYFEVFFWRHNIRPTPPTQ